MNRQFPHENRRLARSRRGLVLLEVVIAAGLVLTLMAVATPVVFQTSRIWKQTRNHQLALDELNGQMDHLLMLSAAEREAALESLEVSSTVAAILEEATLEADLISDSDGKRIELSIDWDRIGDPPPLTLTAWVAPLPEASDQLESGGAQEESDE